MPSLNQVFLMGHLTRDAEARFTSSGTKVCNFSIATSSGMGDNKRSEYHNIIVWNTQNIPMADQASNLKKGDLVFVTGRLQTSSWDDKNGGGKRYKTEIVAGRVNFLRSPNSNPSQPDDEFGFAQPVDIDVKDIPF